MVEEFETDVTLFTEGKRVGQVMYVVLSGAVEILKRDKAGNNGPLTTLRQNAFFDEMSLFEHQERSATARIKESGEFLVVTKVAFDRMMKNDPAIVNQMLLVFIRTFSQWLRPTSSLYAG
ncbi:MAG: cyclic nucleotide-binding domain-containing protein [Candidatus Latescibacteria bacterium]|nr:cyclic nucleotide-binding domain-containing protein [Candidatus Latescibacterota bacterium]